ncbi:MAG: YraN family protein [Kangiellaceae bacterium]|nr:YraN family protein [Kangiellaceae bacterium]
MFDDQKISKREFGDKLEDFAAKQLTIEGLKIISHNYLCKMGEVDIIAKEKNDLVFIEVRYRKSEQYGGSLASVDQKKQRRISMAASHYLQKHNLTNKLACRFDVFAVTGIINHFEYQWIKAAFGSF